MEAIEKINAVLSIVSEFTEEDVANLVAARDRIEHIAKENPTDQDKIGLTRIDSILAIVSTLPTAE